MKLSEASDFFEKLLSETNEPAEIRVYKKYIAILSDLNSRNLLGKQVRLIEDKLDSLALTADVENRAKYFNQQLAVLIKFLKEQLRLVSEGYYTAMGIALGVALGAGIGSAINIGAGIAIGIAIGLAIGAGKDAKAKKERRVLKTKLD